MAVSIYQCGRNKKCSLGLFYLSYLKSHLQGSNKSVLLSRAVPSRKVPGLGHTLCEAGTSPRPSKNWDTILNIARDSVCFRNFYLRNCICYFWLLWSKMMTRSNLQKEEFIFAYGSRGRIHSGEGSSQLEQESKRSHFHPHEGNKETKPEAGQAIKPLKTCPKWCTSSTAVLPEGSMVSQTAPPTGDQVLITCAYGGHCSLKPLRGSFNF